MAFVPPMSEAQPAPPATSATRAHSTGIRARSAGTRAHSTGTRAHSTSPWGRSPGAGEGAAVPRLDEGAADGDAGGQGQRARLGLGPHLLAGGPAGGARSPAPRRGSRGGGAGGKNPPTSPGGGAPA